MSCLFDSLAPAVHLSSRQLRQYIVSYLESNPKLMDDISANDVIQWTEDKSLQSYTNKMRSQSAWGGAIELKAFCDLFRAAVVVHVLYNKRKFTFMGNKEAQKIIHVSYNGYHYEPMYTMIL